MLAEEQIRGVELTVGVIEALDGSVRALPCSEVRLERGRPFDYGSKYRGEGAMELTPACVVADLLLAAQSLAVLCHQAFGCAGYSRTDCIAVDDELVFLELNTLPGLSAASFIPQQLVAAGIDFREFMDTQLTLAVRRTSIAPVVRTSAGGGVNADQEVLRAR